MERGDMPFTAQGSFLDFQLTIVFIKWATLIILSFYAIFALLVVRQVDLMSKTLVTGVSPFVQAFAILHAGFAIGLIILTFGLL